MTSAGVRGQLRRQLLHVYDTDVDFSRALIALWLKRARRLQLGLDWRTIPPVIWVQEPSSDAVRADFEARGDVAVLTLDERTRAWNEAFGPVAAYLDGLTEIAGRFGLDRLGIEGVTAIHTWCFNRQEVIAFGGRWPRRLFSDSYQTFGPVVEVGDIVEHDLGVIELDGVLIAVKDREVRPVLHFDGRTAHWDPTSEPRSVAFARLRKRFGKRHEQEIRSELDRLARLAADLGATAIDTRPNVGRDLEWLFWHLRYREGPAAVATRAGLSSSDVAKIRRAVWRIAALTDIKPYPSWSDRMAD